MVIRSLFRTAVNAGKNKAKSKYRHIETAISEYEANEIKKDKIFNKKYAIESKGYRKVNIYKNGSTQLKWAVARFKRDGYITTGMGPREYTVLFIKKAVIKPKKAAVRKTRRTARIHRRV